MKRKILSIILTIFVSINIFIVPTFAQAHGPNNIVYTPYGTCTSEFYYDSANSTHNITLGGVTIPQVGPVNLLRYTFTHPYTGTFDLDITISGVLSNRWELMTSNCYLMSVVDETTLRFAVNNATYCEIAIMPSQYNNALVFFLENQNLTPVEDTTTTVNDILSHVTYMDGQIQQIHADTTMIKNLIISMSGYTAGSDDNIATDMDTLISIMTQINSKITNLEELNWTSLTYWPQFSSNLSANYGNSNQVTGHTVYLKMTEPSVSQVSQNAIYKVKIPVRYYNSANRVSNTLDIKIYTVVGSNYLLADYDVLNYAVDYDYITLYYRIFNNSYDYVIMLNDSVYQLTTVNGSAVTGYYITDNYIDYWRLYQLFNDNNNNSNILNRMNDVINAINNMSLNVNQLTVNATGITYNTNQTEVNNSINTYNTNINQVFNIENNLSSNFDTYNQQFDPSNDLNTFLPTTQNAYSFMGSIVSDLYNFKIIKYPAMLTLVGIVIIAILG